MNNNGANNEQWRVAGSNKTNTGGVRDSPRKTEQNGTYSNEGDQGHHTQSMKPGGGKVPAGINKTGNAVGWSKINGKIHVESNSPNTEDGMEHYSTNVGYNDVRLMCGNRKGFNVAQRIKQFIAAAHVIDKDFSLLPLGGQDNNICIPADVPNLKEGIQTYFPHRVSFNNVAVKLLPLPHPPVWARTDARTNPSAQRATKLRSVLARVYAVSRQNQITTVP
jgi:hypothetical protein